MFIACCALAAVSVALSVASAVITFRAVRKIGA